MNPVRAGLVYETWRYNTAAQLTTIPIWKACWICNLCNSNAGRTCPVLPESCYYVWFKWSVGTLKPAGGSINRCISLNLWLPSVSATNMSFHFCRGSSPPNLTESLVGGEEHPQLLKYCIYPYKHIFVYLWSSCTIAASERTTWEKGKKYSPAINKWFTNLKFKCMPKKTAHPKKNKPTKKKSSAQRKPGRKK